MVVLTLLDLTLVLPLSSVACAQGNNLYEPWTNASIQKTKVSYGLPKAGIGARAGVQLKRVDGITS